MKRSRIRAWGTADKTPTAAKPEIEEIPGKLLAGSSCGPILLHFREAARWLWCHSPVTTRNDAKAMMQGMSTGKRRDAIVAYQVVYAKIRERDVRPRPVLVPILAWRRDGAAVLTCNDPTEKLAS